MPNDIRLCAEHELQLCNRVLFVGLHIVQKHALLVAAEFSSLHDHVCDLCQLLPII